MKHGIARAPDGHAVASYPAVERPRVSVRALVVALRPRQWTKNLLLFAGLVFAGEFGDPGQWARAGAAFIAYCLASSATYLVNDVRDRRYDEAHLVKRSRPVASGALAPWAALSAGALLAVGALTVATALGPTSAALMACFLALQLAYTFALKRVAVVDVLAIAGLFVMRAAAGAEAIDVRISPWLLLCTALLALLLALGKRRAELAADTGEARPALSSYRLGVVDRWLGALLAACALAYTAYAWTWESAWMLVTVPFVLAGLRRYARLVRDGHGEEPETLLVSDSLLLGTVSAWAAACVAVVALVVDRAAARARQLELPREGSS